VTEHDFKAFFDQYGTVIDAQLMIDKDTGRPRGFGFVTFDSDQAVERIVAEKFLKLKNKPIEVKRAEPRNRGESNKEDKTVQQNASAYQNGMNPAMMSQYYQQWQKYMQQMQQMMSAMSQPGGGASGAQGMEGMQQYMNQLQQMGYNTQAMQPFLQQMQAPGATPVAQHPSSSGSDRHGSRSPREDSRDRDHWRYNSRRHDDGGDRDRYSRDRDRDYDRRDRQRGRDKDYGRDDERRRSRSPQNRGGSGGNSGLAGRIGKGDRRRR
jgi:RNA-binding protein Musashi